MYEVQKNLRSSRRNSYHASKRGVRIQQFLTAVVLCISAVLLSVRFDKPFIGQHDWNGVVYGQAAKNFVRFGYMPLRFGATLATVNTPAAERKFLTHYPPTLPILMSLSYHLFGMSEWSTRFVPILASIASIFLIIEIGKKLWNWQAGVLAGIFSAVTPIFLYYGKNPVHDVVQLPFSLLAFFAYLHVQEDDRTVWKLVLLFSIMAAALVGWSGYYAAILIAIHGISFAKHKTLFWFLPVMSIVLFFLFLWHVSLLDARFTRELTGAVTSRIGASSIPWGDFFRKEFRYSMNLFTATLLLLSGCWVFMVFLHGIRLRSFRRDIFVLFLGIYGIAHIVIFREAGWYHEYLLFPLLPFLSITAALFLTNVLNPFQLSIKLGVVLIVIAIVATERIGYARALLASEYVRDIYEEAIQFPAQHPGEEVPDDRDVFFVFYADKL